MRRSKGKTGKPDQNKQKQNTNKKNPTQPPKAPQPREASASETSETFTQVKHEPRGKLAGQATRAPRANIAEEQLALKSRTSDEHDPISNKGEPKQANNPPKKKKHPTDHHQRSET